MGGLRVDSEIPLLLSIPYLFDKTELNDFLFLFLVLRLPARRAVDPRR